MIPVKNPLLTPSGKIEIVSQVITDYFGNNNPSQPAIPTYKPHPDKSQQYPLYMVEPSQVRRTSQWRNLTFDRDEKQDYVNGYNTMPDQPCDADSRGINDGDVVRVYNSRGAILCGAYITQRTAPGNIRIWEGGWCHPATTRSGWFGENIRRERERPDFRVTARTNM